MVASAEPTKTIKVTFPRPVLDLLLADVPARERNGFIVAATREAMRRKLLALKPDSPLDQDMAEILQRKEQGEIKLHSHAEVWGV